jgi:hypothetical protein
LAAFSASRTTARVHDHGKHVVGSWRRLAEAHGERVLRDVHLGEVVAGVEVLLPPRHEAGAPAIGRHGFRQHGHGIFGDVAAVHDHHARLGLLIYRDTDALLKFGCHISVTIDYHESMIAKHKKKTKKMLRKKLTLKKGKPKK